MQTQRGSYGEIPMHSLDAETRERVAALVAAAADAAKIDEHGSWEFGVTRLNRRGTRWAALNWDLYAHGHDAHSGRLLLPGAHPRVEATGWHKVVTGRRAAFWKFAAPTVD